MGSIRVGSKNVKIEVNDNGDTITLPFGDATFENRFYIMVDKLHKKSEEMSPKAEEVDAIENELKRSSAQSELLFEFHKFLAEELNTLFGKDTCVKVFDGIEIPSYEMVIDFIEQLNPFFEAKAAERQKDLDKYSPERNGNA